MSEKNGLARRKARLPEGVYVNGQGFQAKKRVAGKVKSLGTYPTPEAALEAYQRFCAGLS